MKKFRLISMVLLFTLIISCFTTGYGIELEDTSILVNQKNSNEKVKVIIQLKEDSIIEHASNLKLDVSKFIESSEAEQLRIKIQDNQEIVQNGIKEVLDYDANFKYNYTNTLNGFSAEVYLNDISKIEENPNVEGVYIDQVYNLPDQDKNGESYGLYSKHTFGTNKEPTGVSVYSDNPNEMPNPTPDMYYAPDAGYTSTLWQNGYDGKGIVVAVIDTGVDPNHELMVLSDENNIKFSKLYIERMIDAASKDIISLNAQSKTKRLNVNDVYQSAKMPFTYDYADSDEDSTVVEGASQHGVHVSGIVAANKKDCPDKFNGIAPEAQIIGMKVFSDVIPLAYSSDVFAAIEDSVTLRVDVLNLSLGSAAGFSKYKDYKEFDPAKIYDNVRKAGIIAMVSAGNDNRVGGTGNYYGYPLTDNPDTALVGASSTVYSATSVASTDNTKNNYPAFKLVSTGEYIPFNDNVGLFLEQLDGETCEFVQCGIGKCEDFENVDVQGKIALISRGELAFTEKQSNASSYGAIAAIIYNNKQEDILNMQQINDFAVCAITLEDSKKLLELADEDKEIEINSSYTGAAPIVTAGLMSYYSSWGPTPDLKFKPEITAPGGKILSTMSNNEYAIMSGTSMSSPYCAGGAALVKQYINENYPNMDFKEKSELIEDLLMSTSRIIFDEYNTPYSPRRQGSGLINLYGAINTETYLYNSKTKKAKIELGDKLQDSFDLSFAVKNLSDEERTYKLKGIVLADYSQQLNQNDRLILPYDFEINAEMTYKGKKLEVIDCENNDSPVTSGSAIVTVRPNKSTNVKVRVTLDSDYVDYLLNAYNNGFFVEGFVELEALDGGEPNLSIPYLGFYGEWDDAPILDKFNAYGENSFYFNNNTFTYGGYMYYPSSNYIAGNNFKGEFKFDYITISPNNDSKGEDIAAAVGMLRNAREINVYIEDENGKLIKELPGDVYTRKTLDNDNGYPDSVNFAKFGAIWDGTNDNGEVVENGQYYYVIKAVIDYKGAKSEITKVPVFVDTQKPNMKACFVEEVEGKKYLKLAMNDNGTMGIIKVLNQNGDVVVNDIDKVLKSDLIGIFIEVDGTEEFTILCNDLGSNLYNQKINVKYTEDNPFNKNIVIEDDNIIIVNKPETGGDDPGTGGDDPGTGGDDPGTGGDDPGTGGDDPGTGGDDPGTGGDDPGTGGDDPGTGGDDPGTGGDDPGTGGDDPGTHIPNEDTVLESSYISINNGTNNITASIKCNSKFEKIVKAIKGKKLIVNINKFKSNKNIKLDISDCVVNVLKENNVGLVLNYADEISYNLTIKTLGEILITMNQAGSLDDCTPYISTNMNYNINITQKGKKVDNKSKWIKVSLDGVDLDDIDRSGAYYCQEDGKLSYIMTYSNENELYFYPKQFGDYHILQYYKTFDDIQESSFKECIEKMASRHIVEGKPNKLFEPSDFVSRAQFITMVMRAIGLEAEKPEADKEWYENIVLLARECGFVSEGEYDASLVISRAEMAKIVSLAHAFLEGNSIESSGKIKFKDVDDTTEFVEYIKYATDNKLINGYPDKRYKPVESTTRAHATMVIYNLLNN